MIFVFSLLAFALLMAYLSQNNILTIHMHTGQKYDLALFIMIVVLSFVCGLRTSYNDTYTYITGFNNAVTWQEYWSEEHSIFGNIGYYAFQVFFHQYISSDYHVFFVVLALFEQAVYICFIRKYSENFVFSIFLYFCIGLYFHPFTAMKQHCAMAILMLALPQLMKKRYVRYYILVFIAMLFHTYALLFAILPLFLNRPWTKVTYITIIAVLAVLFTFESTITTFLEYAEYLGKEIPEYQVFDTAGISLFRLGVYMVLPFFTFVFQGRLKCAYNRETALLTNMSILSFLVMCLGLVSAANLFGRSAIYYEMGTIVMFPWVINCMFTKKSRTLIYGIASLCYLLFFYMDIGSFVTGYNAITIFEFIAELI